MTDEPLFLPGWEVEPCDTAPPAAPARLPLCLRDIETVRPIDDYPEGTETCPDPSVSR